MTNFVVRNVVVIWEAPNFFGAVQRFANASVSGLRVGPSKALSAEHVDSELQQV